MKPHAKERTSNPGASYSCAEDVIADDTLTESEKEYILKSMAFEIDVLSDKDEEAKSQGEKPVNIDEIHKALDQLDDPAPLDRRPIEKVGGTDQAKRGFSTIIAALSGEIELDSKVIAMADRLVETSDGDVIFVSVIQPDMSAAYAGAMSPMAGVVAPPPPDVSQNVEMRVDERRARIRKTISDSATELGDYTLDIRYGEIIHELLRASEDAQADLVIVGSHERSWFEGLLSPETAHRVAKGSVCPVLIVPE